MKQLTAEACLARILRDIKKRETVDYWDKNSVRRYNAAMDRIVKNANFFCDNYPDKMELFTAFLEHPDYSIAGTFTSVLHGLHNANAAHKLAALTAAKRLLLRPEIDELSAYVWKINIKRWESEM